MTTWAALFERGADYGVDTAAVRAALAARRGDGENAEAGEPASDDGDGRNEAGTAGGGDSGNGNDADGDDGGSDE